MGPEIHEKELELLGNYVIKLLNECDYCHEYGAASWLELNPPDKMFIPEEV